MQEGERPRRPENAGSLGFSDALWWLVWDCWSESPSVRPTARQLLLHLEYASRTWIPPLEYPIPKDLFGEAEIDFTFGDERNKLVNFLESRPFTRDACCVCI